MSQFESTRLQSPNDTQWLPDNNILRIFASYFSFESVGDIGIAETLDTFWHVALQDEVERIFIVAGRQNFRFAFTWVSESPCLFIDNAFPPRFPTTASRTGWQMPAGCIGQLPKSTRESRKTPLTKLAIYQWGEAEYAWSTTALISKEEAFRSSVHWQPLVLHREKQYNLHQDWNRKRRMLVNSDMELRFPEMFAAGCNAPDIEVLRMTCTAPTTEKT